MKNIYFYSPGASGEILKYRGHSLFVNTVPVYLHSYLKNHCPELAEQLNWAKIQILEKTVDELVNDINLLDIDIFCVSAYVWNRHHLFDTIKKLKTRLNKKIVVVAGGPSVDPHRDSDFFKNNPNIDYAIFAQGEKAFAAIIKKIVNNHKIDFFNTTNLAWPDENKNVKLTTYEFLKRSHGSPYIDGQDILKKISIDPDYQGYKFYFPYETSKGCPYKCSFCDWTSGLSHKVSHRTVNNWDEELSLLGRLGFVNLYISDANFGQHRQDMEIAKTMVQLKKQKGYNFSIIDTNFSKLKKKESFAILDLLLGEKIISMPKFAVQDTNEQVLKNIDRPDVSWSKHRQYINKLLKKYPDTDCQIELIQGLPGQTRDTWEQTLIDTQGFTLRVYYWFMLPNSPVGYDDQYRESMKIKTMSVVVDGFNDQPNDVITETFSFDYRDYMYMTLLSKIVNPFYHLSRYQNRRELFDRVRSSRFLEQTLDQLEIAFKNGEKLMPIVYNFVDNMFTEHNNWPEDILLVRKHILGDKHETI
jgi:putative methyltransferase